MDIWMAYFQNFTNLMKEIFKLNIPIRYSSQQWVYLYIYAYGKYILYNFA